MVCELMKGTYDSNFTTFLKKYKIEDAEQNFPVLLWWGITDALIAY